MQKQRQRNLGKTSSIFISLGISKSNLSCKLLTNTEKAVQTTFVIFAQWDARTLLNRKGREGKGMNEKRDEKWRSMKNVNHRP